MSFRDVLVVLRPYPAVTPAAAVEQAVALAATFASRLSAVACAIKPKVPRSILGNALLDVSAMVGEESRKSADDAHKLLAAFEQAARLRNVLGRQMFEACTPAVVPDLLVERARLYDLSILPTPEIAHVAQFDARWYAESIIFESGHPVIVLPRDGQGTMPKALDAVLVAWDKSRAASRAIADALPILKTATRVRLLTVVGEKRLPSSQSPAELVDHLALHGVKAVAEEVEADGRSIGKVLDDQVKGYAADLLVMGAYGHSRLREFVLGGATNSILSKPPTAVFLSH
ncbi:Universal stress protein family protein [Enhydrobacter aerosaccus]|uniref:Universal stress protein family protein n=1 Tax=Enhydrobacter aerosaccus TaxID=225324 RepID=A0A1T4MP28_9HYPH|nr:universal stress protein [Enhydrobacter aerosaccus]SJZ68478.1 Universal stress protein family protein [Enhydrobacter aerosaccus]